MATTTIAQPTHTTIPVDRITEGRAFYRELGHTFRHEHGAWIVPIHTVEGRVYEVRLGPVETCECTGHKPHGARCAHVVAASIAQAKSCVCSCCGERVLVDSFQKSLKRIAFSPGSSATSSAPTACGMGSGPKA